MQKTGAFEAALTISDLHTDGFSAATSGTEADGAYSTRVSANLRYQTSDTLAVGAALFTQDSMQEFDGYDAFFTLSDQDNVQNRTESGARAFAELSLGNTVHVFEITGYQINRDFDQAGEISTYSGSRISLGWQGATEVSQALSLVYGADTMQEAAEYSNLPAGSADTSISGAFAEALWAPRDDLDIPVTLRADQHSTFGLFPTGRLALAWRPATGTTVRAAAATGFRAPSIDELYGDYPGFFPFVGNPDLTPEESTSFELGIEHDFAGGATISATAFRLGIDNLISSAFGAPSTLENLPGESVRQGVELAGSVPLGQMFTLSGAYTYTDARRSDGTRIGLVPFHDLTLSLDAALGARLEAGLSVK